DLTALINLVVATELVFAKYVHSNLVARLKLWRCGGGCGQGLLFGFTEHAGRAAGNQKSRSERSATHGQLIHSIPHSPRPLARVPPSHGKRFLDSSGNPG